MTSDLQNRRALLLARCSTPDQAQFSIAQQIDHMSGFAGKNQLSVVGEIRLEGVSGLDPAARTDIDQIVERKRVRNDFDIVLIADVTRLTRGGVGHGFYIKYELERHGVEIVSAKDDLPRGRYGWVVLGMKLEEANAEVDLSVFRMQRGYTASVLDGRNCHSTQTPYGCDRLYASHLNEPLFRLRNLADGSQQMLAVESDDVLRVFPPNERNKKSLHYDKQPTERITFVPGARDRVSTVQRIFQLHYVDGWGWHRIAKALNDEGVQSAKGRLWTECSVRKILMNPVYTGVGIANARAVGLLWERTRDGTPVRASPKSRVSADGQRQLKRYKPVHRPADQWLPVKYPHMVNYLSNLTPAVLRRVRDRQIKDLTDRAQNGPKTRSHGDRHLNSPYFLKNVFITLPSGDKMSGYTCRSRRYYSNAAASYRPESKKRMIAVRAELVESAVLHALQEAVQRPNLSALVQREAAAYLESRPKRGVDVPALRQRRAKLLAKIGQITRVHDDLSDEELRSLVQPVKQELKSVEEQIEQEARRDELFAHDVTAHSLVEATMKRMRDLRAQLAEVGASPKFRRLVELVVQRLTFDEQTRVIDLSLVLPIWADTQTYPLSGKVSMVDTTGPACTHHAAPHLTVALGDYRAVYTCTRGTRVAHLRFARNGGCLQSDGG